MFQNALKVSILLLFISCGGDDELTPQVGTPSDTPIETDYELVNARRENDRIYLDSFRYRELYAYDEGKSSVTIPKETFLDMTEDDIKVYVKVEASDFSRVDGLTLKGSEQPWSQMKFISKTTGDVVKLCVQIQPKSQTISSVGITEVELIKKNVFTVLGDTKDCVGVSANGVDVFSGIETSYLYINDDTIVEAEAKSDMKAGNQRVGTQVEFSFLISI